MIDTHCCRIIFTKGFDICDGPSVAIEITVCMHRYVDAPVKILHIVTKHTECQYHVCYMLHNFTAKNLRGEQGLVYNSHSQIQGF